jgi:hypothetical protein
MIDDDAKVTAAVLEVLNIDPNRPLAANDIENYLIDYTHVFSKRDPKDVGRELPRLMKRDIVASYDDTYNRVVVWCLPNLVLHPPQYIRRSDTNPRNIKAKEGGNLFE